MYGIENQKDSKSRFILIFLALLATVLILFLILNYFSLIPLSKNFPQFFGWLPYIDKEEMPEPSLPARRIYPEDFFLCPVKGEQCKSAYSVLNSERNRVEGIGYFYLLRNTELQAMMDGTYTVEHLNDGNTQILLTDSDKNIEAQYILFDADRSKNEEITSPKEIVRGDIIYSLGDSQPVIDIGIARNYALVVYVRNVKNGESVNAVVDKKTGRVTIR